MLEKKAMVFLVALMVAGLGSTTPADAAQQYPRKPITLIVPYVAGSGTDTNARVIAKYSTKYLGVTVVVVNKPGAAGALGYTQLAQAKLIQREKEFFSIGK
jgi:tripartite-type tricarboxylate transporter receptor subunit TctC